MGISYTDEELMALYQRGESAAFEALYRRHSGRVYGFLKLRTAQPGDAEEILQQTFLKVHRNRRRYDPTLPFLPWLFSITRHVLIDHARKRRAIPVSPEKLIALADRGRAPEKEETPRDWDEILKLLPAEQRELVTSRYEEGLSFEEIASRKQVTAVSARKRLSRALQTLRLRLGEGVSS